jgi:hypothetical protein
MFDRDNSSPLLGLLSPSERRKGKLSRVTFNAALKSIWTTFAESDPDFVYKVLGAYLSACLAGLRVHNAEANIINPTLFKALILLFPNVAERVAHRQSGEYTVKNFNGVLDAMFRRVKKAELQHPGTSHLALYDSFRKSLSAGFSLGKTGL